MSSPSRPGSRAAARADPIAAQRAQTAMTEVDQAPSAGSTVRQVATSAGGDDHPGAGSRESPGRGLSRASSAGRQHAADHAPDHGQDQRRPRPAWEHPAPRRVMASSPIEPLATPMTNRSASAARPHVPTRAASDCRAISSPRVAPPAVEESPVGVRLGDFGRGRLRLEDHRDPLRAAVALDDQLGLERRVETFRDRDVDRQVGPFEGHERLPRELGRKREPGDAGGLDPGGRTEQAMADVGDLDRPPDRPATGRDPDHESSRVDVQLGPGRGGRRQGAEPGVEPFVGRTGSSGRRSQVGPADRGQEAGQSARDQLVSE